jgi:flagellar biogenesis protein FliO
MQLNRLAQPYRTFSDLRGAGKYFISWLSLTKQHRRRTQSMQLLETIVLTTQASIALVRFEQDTLMLGVTPQNVTVLAKRPFAGASKDTESATGTLVR